MNKTALLIFSVFLVIVAILGGFYFYSTPGDSIYYRNDQYRIAFLYSKALELEEVKEDTTETLIFQNLAAGKGFQVYVVPFKGDKIDGSRIKIDVPNADLSTLTSVSLSGKTAIEFKSTDLRLGNIKDVWFTHNGYLFEFSTLESIDEELKKVLNTIEFY